MPPCSLRHLSFTLFIIACQANGSPSLAQVVAKPSLSPQHHPWARFEPGAWRTTKLTTKTLEANGNISCQTVTTRLVTLEELREQSYSLREESFFDARGRKITGQPSISWHTLYFDNEASVAAVEPAKPEILLINGQPITCRVLQVRFTECNQSKTAHLFIEDKTSPYVFRRVIDETQIGQETGPLRESIQEVVAVDMPYPYHGHIISTAHIKSVLSSSKGKTVRLSIVCDDIPGGVVAEWSKELDRDGRVLRRGYQELTAYGLQTPLRSVPRRRLMRRRGR